MHEALKIGEGLLLDPVFSPRYTYGMMSQVPIQGGPLLFINGVITPTSSTAQGGGGSFKNRKPIGEIGCCESRMAEQKH